MEVLIHIPKFQWLDSVEFSIMLKQLPILAVGIIIYISSMWIAYKVSANRFQKYDNFYHEHYIQVYYLSLLTNTVDY